MSIIRKFFGYLNFDEVNFSDLLRPTNDEYVNEFNLIILKAIHDNKKVYPFIHTGALEIDVYTPPQDKIEFVYVYITKKVSQW